MPDLAPHAPLPTPRSGIPLIVPVIDLKDGQVVRGIAGQRAQYRAVRSRIANDARPSTVAIALVEQFGFGHAYVADLDAIAGSEPDWNTYQRIADTGLRLLVDAGVGNPARAEQMRASAEATLAFEGIVVGLESVASPTELGEIAGQLGPQLGVFSLDLKAGVTLADTSKWPGREAVDIADAAIEMGFRRLIVLDLASVGVDRGPSVMGLCQTIRARHTDIPLISGGGVRDIADVHSLLAAGCNSILVASALHDARITPEDLGKEGGR
ncbi:MAG: HisA/HisF-related TIM barrel protein, partial [Pirellulaceae bacterium]